jgi:hypothetical protein
MNLFSELFFDFLLLIVTKKVPKTIFKNVDFYIFSRFFPIFPDFRLWSQSHICVFWSY